MRWHDAFSMIEKGAILETSAHSVLATKLCMTAAFKSWVSWFLFNNG